MSVSMFFTSGPTIFFVEKLKIVEKKLALTKLLLWVKYHKSFNLHIHYSERLREKKLLNNNILLGTKNK